jgi:hypothetical protein
MISLGRLALAALALADAAFAQPAARSGEHGHCSPGETVVFSCVTGRPLASVCAAPRATDQQRYLQYRYGSPGRPKIVLPPRDDPPGTNTDALSYFNAIGDGNGYIRFRSGRYSYIVYAFSARQVHATRHSAPGWDNWHGVAIERGGRIQKLLRCKPFQGVHSEISPTFLAKNADFLTASDDRKETLERVNTAATRSRPR